jgi:peptide/nickel transport system permease protein
MTGAAQALPARQAVRSRGLGRQSLLRLNRQPVTLAAFGVLVAVLLAGALAPVLAPRGWNAIDLDDSARNQPPSLAHLLGTDQVGRDTLDRLLWGIHFSEQTAVVGGIAATLLALVVALAAGFYGGWADATLMRGADLVAGLPVLVLLIALFGVLEPVTVWETTAIFALSMWAFAARVLRARITSLREEEFVQAARAVGASNRRIMVRHLIPNAAGAIVVCATSLIGQIVLIEATAEFFGFGVLSVTRPTLGNLIGEAASTGIGPYNTLGLGWWTWLAPGVTLVLLLVCVNLLGDGLDAALNPRATQVR